MDFDNKVSECIQKCDLFEQKKLSNENKNSEKKYQNSFEDIINFSKTIKDTDKKKIDYVLYNNQNDDGTMSGYICYQYLVHDQKNKKKNKKNVQFKPVKPSDKNNALDYRIKKLESELKDKIIIICDVYFGLSTIKYLSSLCKKVYIIDDHKLTNNNTTRFNSLDNVYSFIGDKHSACAYTWKFFYPKKDVPNYIIQTDNKDLKLYLPFIDTSNYLTSYNNFRITNNPYLNKNSPNYFEKVSELVNQPDSYKKLVGKYYDEVENNIKDQVAKNAVKRKFQGYNVYVLNYSDPVLYKKVARQMISNAEKKGDKIDFAVIWGWEYTSNAYKILLSEKHEGTPKYNLGLLAKNLAKKGGHFKGGGGKAYVGNFYWPRNKNHDIWDLFT